MTGDGPAGIALFRTPGGTWVIQAWTAGNYLKPFMAAEGLSLDLAHGLARDAMLVLERSARAEQARRN